MEQFSIPFPDRPTFTDVKNAVISTILSTQPAETIYIVSNAYSRFSIYIVKSQNSDNYLAELENSLASHVDTIEIIPKTGFIRDDLDREKKTVAPNVFLVERQLSKHNWFLANKKFKSKCPIISFYSFKGGLGRTTALVLSAIHLARQGKKIVLVDFDLEAPGLASLFFSDFPELAAVPGILDFFINLNVNKGKIERVRLSDYFFTINKHDIVGEKGGELIVLPASSTDISSSSSLEYINKLSKINFDIDKAEKFSPDLLFAKINNEIKPDYIFVDTRTGINDIGGLVFSRYSTISFLFFYGNQQNMFGLSSVVSKLKDLNTHFYLVNSPVPKGELGSEEINYYLNTTYEIFSEFYYDQNIPVIYDQTADHFPINIPYSDTASFLNSVSKIKELLEEKGNENPYIRIAKLISSENDSVIAPALTQSGDSIVHAMSEIAQESAASEQEFRTDDDLRRKFYPRKDYKHIFDANKFLILGEKGAGKTALYAMLSHKNYTEALANYCEVSDTSLGTTFWIKALDNTEDFPSSRNFGAVKGFTISQLTTYWLILLFRYNSDMNSNDETTTLKKIKESSILDLKNMAQQESLGEVLEEELSTLNKRLATENKYLVFIYDYLDSLIPEEDDLRGKLIGSLLNLWYSFTFRFSNVKAKIFLRKDIFDREITSGITDKVKIRNYTVELEWGYDQLLNIVWKRMLDNQQYSASVKDFFAESNEYVDTSYHDGLGSIPKLSESENRVLLERLLGKQMGGNNKAFPYNWVIYHISDNKRRIHPRSLINLFSLAAKNQLQSGEKVNTILKPRSMEDAMKNVSDQRVRDIIEEYPSLEGIFKNLYQQVEFFPAKEGELMSAFGTILPAIPPREIIGRLDEIGVLYPYKFKKQGDEQRYHVPDLYLLGMNLKRRGHGVHKALFGGRKQ